MPGRRLAALAAVSGLAALAVGLAGVSAAFTAFLALLGGACALALVVGKRQGASCPESESLLEARRMARSLVLPDLRRHGTELLRLRELFRRSLGDASLPDPSEGSELALRLDELLRESIALACRWQGIESHLKTIVPSRLRRKILDAEGEGRRCRDEGARRQYEAIRESLQKQLDDFEALTRCRERISSRLLHHRTRLEELHLSLVRLLSSTAQVEARSLELVEEGIDELGRDLEEEASALEDLAVPACLPGEDATSGS